MMNLIKSMLKTFHNTKSFKQHGFKQVSTWIGVLIFLCLFDKDLLVLVHNILTDASLAQKIATGLGGAILVMLNKK